MERKSKLLRFSLFFLAVDVISIIKANKKYELVRIVPSDFSASAEEIAQITTLLSSVIRTLLQIMINDVFGALYILDDNKDFGISLLMNNSEIADTLNESHVSYFRFD